MGDSKLRLRPGHALTAVLFVGGVVLLALMARDIGIQPVRDHARALAWYLPAGVAIHALSHFMNALGWRYAIGPEARRVPLLLNYGAWSAGDVVNWGTPGSVGGEVLRAHLIRDRVPMSTGIASVAIGRLAQITAQFTFIGFGLALAWSRLELEPRIRAALLVVIGGAVLFVVGGYVLQRTRLFGHLATLARRAGLRGSLMDRVEAALHRVDANMTGYHRERPADLGRAYACYLCGWLVVVFDCALSLVALGASADWRAVLAVESLSVFVEAISFLVPAKVGSDEAGRVLTFTALGYTSAVGFSFSIFRRLKELIWFSGCFAVLFILKRRADRAALRDAPASSNVPPP